MLTTHSYEHEDGHKKPHQRAIKELKTEIIRGREVLTVGNILKNVKPCIFKLREEKGCIYMYIHNLMLTTALKSSSNDRCMYFRKLKLLFAGK